jgi:hypothetical protein
MCGQRRKHTCKIQGEGVKKDNNEKSMKMKEEKKETKNLQNGNRKCNGMEEC